MKIIIETDAELVEDQIIIRCKELNESVLELQRELATISNSGKNILAEKDGAEYYLELRVVEFIEASANQILIHTADDIYQSRQKLYELDEILPKNFIRVSKSTIVNTNRISSIKKNITGASEISFKACNKVAYASRNYIKALLDKMDEKRVKR